MPAIVITRKTGPVSYQPADNVVISGGQLVIPHASVVDRIDVAGAGALNVLGVAVVDAIAPEDLVTAPVSGVLNAAQTNTWTDVAYGGQEVDGVLYAANAAFGDYLKAASLGRVTPIAADGDPRLIVARCVQPGGVLSGATGLTRIL